MLAATVAGASHPAVAVLLGLGATGLAGAVVAMAWNVHARQIRLAEHLARRQFIVTGDAGSADPQANGNGDHAAAPDQLNGAAGAGNAAVVIDGPETVVAGEQARYRVRTAGNQKLVSWAAGGGALAQAPDPSHPGDLLVVADEPGDLMITARVREGLTERRATKSVTAVTDVNAITPPFTLRLFLRGWGLVVVSVLVAGFAGSLDALGVLPSSDFIALVSPLAALLAVVAIARGASELPGNPGKGAARRKP